MPITLLDVILLGVMLISGLLAHDPRVHARGPVDRRLGGGSSSDAFRRSPSSSPSHSNISTDDIVASAVTAAGIFLGTLIIVSIFTVRISDKILDSRIGALDRTLGFLFGLARGLIIVVVAFVFFDWLVPAKQQPSWVANAKSRVVLQATGSWLMSLLPEDVDKYISKALQEGTEGRPRRRGGTCGRAAGPRTDAGRSGHVALRGHGL